MNYIKSIIIKKRDLAKNEMEYEKSILFDVYTLTLVFLLLCNLILNVILKYYINCVIFGSFTFFMLSTLLWPDRIRFNTKLLMLLFFFLNNDFLFRYRFRKRLYELFIIRLLNNCCSIFL